jgi:hypothetical protein
MGSRQGKTRTVLLLVAVAASAVAVAGCGGSSGGAAATIRSVPGRQLMASADRICERLNVKLVASTPSRHATRAQIAQNAFAHAVLERQTLAELEALSPPPTLARDWARILQYRRLLAAQLVTLGRAWTTASKQDLLSLAKSKARLHEEMYELARQDGFTACSRVGSKS